MKIDLDIPVPEHVMAGRPAGRGAKYPFATMPVGASVLVPKADGARICSAAKQWKARHPGWDYRSQTTDDGTRLWRVA